MDWDTIIKKAKKAKDEKMHEAQIVAVSMRVAENMKIVLMSALEEGKWWADGVSSTGGIVLPSEVRDALDKVLLRFLPTQVHGKVTAITPLSVEWHVEVYPDDCNN